MSSYEEAVLAAILNPPDFNEPLPNANLPSTIYATVITFLIISWIAVIFRLWVRLRLVHDAGWDDALVFVAAILNTLAGICVCLSVKYGFGQHMLAIGLEPVKRFHKAFYIENAIYMTESMIIKLSLLVQYLRIFKAGIMRWICFALLALVIAWGLTFSFLGWFPCFPVSGMWDRTSRSAKCYGFGFSDLDTFVMSYKAYAASNMCLDILIFLTPLVLFKANDLRAKNVLAMLGVFAFGGIVVAVSVWRLYSITVTRAATYPYLDTTWFSPIPIILACLEVDLAIICASMPIFWPVLEKSISAIFVSYEVEVVEEIMDSNDPHHEMKSLKHRQGSIASNATSERDLTRDEEDGILDRTFTVGPDPLADVAKTLGPKTDVKSEPKSKWEI